MTHFHIRSRKNKSPRCIHCGWRHNVDAACKAKTEVKPTRQRSLLGVHKLIPAIVGMRKGYEVCQFCDGSTGDSTLTAECPNMALSLEQRERVRSGAINFQGGRWVRKTTGD